MKRMLAAPFVVTLSVSACAKHDGGSEEPKPPPTIAPTVAPPPDPSPAPTIAGTTSSAAPANSTGLIYDGFGACYREADGQKKYAGCPDALLPVADKGRAVFKYGGDCKTAPDGKRVRCPPEGPTLALPEPSSIEKGGQWTSVQIGTLHCLQGVHMKCPPRVACNPPPPRTVPCPQELLPTLRTGVEPTRRDGARCFYDVVEVACPAK